MNEIHQQLLIYKKQTKKKKPDGDYRKSFCHYLNPVWP